MKTRTEDRLVSNRSYASRNTMVDCKNTAIKHMGESTPGLVRHDELKFANRIRPMSAL